MLAGAELAMAQTLPRYRFLVIDPPSGFDHTEALGLNEDGAVVGRYFDTFFGPFTDRPFVWFLNSTFGQSAKTLLDLNDLDDGTGDPRGIARDINVDGFIIGERHASGQEQAAVWDLTPLPTNDAEVDDLGTFSSSGCFESGLHSHGFEINDDDPPVIVGWSTASVCEDPCPCPGCEDCPSGFEVCVERGFRKVVDGNDLDPDTDMLFPAASADGYTRSAGVNIGGRAVGLSHPCPSNETKCGTQQDGAEWPASGSPNELEDEFDCTGPGGTTETQHEATGINDADNIVGSGFETIECDGECSGDCDGDLCVERALFWEDPGATTTPVVIGTIDTNVVPFNRETRAEAINDAETSETCLQVVGGDQSQFLGLIWNRDADQNWTVAYLDDKVWQCSGITGEIQIANDINDKGWIAGTLNLNPGGIAELRAVLLICAGDLNEDGSVNGTDLGILLEEWGDPGCGGASPCVADLDCDGDVDGIDLGGVLGQWDRGGCRPLCESSESMMASSSAEDLLTPEVIAFVEALLAQDQIETATQFLGALIGQSTE